MILDDYMRAPKAPSSHRSVLKEDCIYVIYTVYIQYLQHIQYVLHIIYSIYMYV